MNKELLGSLQERERVREMGRTALVEYQNDYSLDWLEGVRPVIQQLVLEGRVEEAAASLWYWFEGGALEDEDLVKEVSALFSEINEVGLRETGDLKIIRALVKEAITTLEGSRNTGFMLLGYLEIEALPKELQKEYINLCQGVMINSRDIDERAAAGKVLWEYCYDTSQFAEFASFLEMIEGRTLIGTPVVIKKMIEDLGNLAEKRKLRRLPKDVDRVFTQLESLINRFEERGLGNQLAETVVDELELKPELVGLLPEKFRQIVREIEIRPEEFSAEEMQDMRRSELISILELAKKTEFHDTSCEVRSRIRNIFPGISVPDLEYLVSFIYTKDKFDYDRDLIRVLGEIVNSWELKSGNHDEIAEVMEIIWRRVKEPDFRKAYMSVKMTEGEVIEKDNIANLEATETDLVIGHAKYLCSSAENYLLDSISKGNVVVVLSKEGKRTLLKLKGKVTALWLDDMCDRNGRKYYRGIWYSPDPVTEEAIVRAYLSGKNEFPLTGVWSPEKMVQDSFEGQFKGEAIIAEAEWAVKEIEAGKWKDQSYEKRLRLLEDCDR